MAEQVNKERGEQKAKKPWYRFPFKTNIKRFLDYWGAPVHDVNETGVRNMRVFIDLRDELRNFEGIKIMNERMTETEREWEGADDEASKKESAKGLMDLFIEYFSAGAEINDSQINTSIGPFTDKKALAKEVEWATDGTGTVNKSFRVENSNINYEYSVPAEKDLVYNDGRKFKFAFIGYRNDNYLSTLTSQINKIIEDTRTAYHSRGTLNTNQEAILTRNLDLIKTSVITMVNDTVRRIKAKDNEHYGNIGGTNGVMRLYNTIETDITNLKKKRLNFDRVHYQHTYKVVLPETYVGGVLTRLEDGTEVMAGGELKKLKDVHGWYKRDDEADDGLDKNGWPLEVGDGSTIFKNQPLEEGLVLLDLYNEGNEEYQKLQGNPKIRKVPKEFISDWNILDVAVWIYVSYDAFRDDLRDARYHPKTISVMERIINDINIVDLNFNIPSNLISGEHIKAEMKLNKFHGAGPKLRPDTDPSQINVEIEPSHLNPGFDTSAFNFQDPITGKSIGWTKHMGRKLYYDVQENTELSNDPTITTRGAALYILHRLFERTKYWDGKGDDKKAGIIQLIGEITKEIGGWDIGPNIGPGGVRWGKPLTKDPFRPSQSGG